MSRFYDMQIMIKKFNKDRIRQITEACIDEWPFEDLDVQQMDTNPVLIGYAESNLSGGESEEQFADRLAAAVWKANKGYCHVTVNALCLEYLPYELHERSYEHYLIWVKKAA